MSLLSNYGVRAQVGDEIVTNGLALYLDAGDPNSYPGSGTTWLDLSGNGRNATLVNGVSYNTESGGVLVFNGSNQQANVGTWFTLPNFTISTWVKPGSSQKQYADIFDNNHTGARNWVMQQNNNNVNQYNFLTFRADFANSQTGNFTLTANTWVNLTFTWNNNRVQGFINGNLFATGSNIGSINYSAQNFVIANWAAGGRQWNGRMGNFLVYNRELSTAEIQQNFNVTKARFGL